MQSNTLTSHCALAAQQRITGSVCYTGPLAREPDTPGRIHHVCLTVADFSPEEIGPKLSAQGLAPSPAQGRRTPLTHWISVRKPDRGGVEGGTPEVYFTDPDGIVIQLQHKDYCGGGGYLGEICESL